MVFFFYYVGLKYVEKYLVFDFVELVVVVFSELQF